MSFSRAQQPEFQALVSAAWAAHCKCHGIAATPKRDRGWYEQELYLAVGVTSTTDCDAGHDYDWVMARFEGIAGGSIKWQMRAFNGDVKRILWWLGKDVGEAELRKHRVDEDYVRRTMRHGCGSKQPWGLSKSQRVTILGEVKRWLRRDMAHARQVAEEKGAALAEEPF